MAVASVEENVKLKDLWQAKYTVAMLKSMKTVTFETPSGNHAYTVVMVVYSTQGVCVCVRPRRGSFEWHLCISWSCDRAFAAIFDS